ncbi:MAG: Gfo/Idh/MocA family oxidoreductase [Armatimonadetes bacterium]|nr:Gfo/Idh/MocA family oxidoreductase [Armatimonadota bacterium]MDW8153438.1 Gfo/Idh/MocA family oxidoreductase [Armatimonadota bacterium]
MRGNPEFAGGERVRVAVVGLGRWGRHHVRIYHELPEADLRAVVSPNPAEVEEFSTRYRIAGYLDHRELIGKVDAASVVTPTSHHYEIARDLVEAGIHVLVEKPITRRVEEAEELIARAHRRGAMLLVGHVERFKPAVEILLHRARDPLFIRARRVRPFQAGRATDVGVVVDLMIHDLDLVLALTGSPVRSVSGVGARLRGEAEDLAAVQLVFEEGCAASLLASRVDSTKAAELEVVTPEERWHLDFLRESLTVWKGNRREELLLLQEEPLRAELRHFLACVRGEQTPRVPGEAGLAALALAHRVLQAMHVVTPRVRTR